MADTWVNFKSLKHVHAYYLLFLWRLTQQGEIYQPEPREHGEEVRAVAFRKSNSVGFNKVLPNKGRNKIFLFTKACMQPK
jgi:hypothetical protein